MGGDGHEAAATPQFAQYPANRIRTQVQAGARQNGSRRAKFVPMAGARGSGTPIKHFAFLKIEATLRREHTRWRYECMRAQRKPSVRSAVISRVKRNITQKAPRRYDQVGGLPPWEEQRDSGVVALRARCYAVFAGRNLDILDRRSRTDARNVTAFASGPMSSRAQAPTRRSSHAVERIPSPPRTARVRLAVRRWSVRWPDRFRACAHDGAGLRFRGRSKAGCRARPFPGQRPYRVRKGLSTRYSISSRHS